jgi:hypothetical protein
MFFSLHTQTNIFLCNIQQSEYADIVKTLQSHVCVCVDSASAALGLSHDGLSSHRAVLPVPLGAAVNKG